MSNVLEEKDAIRELIARYCFLIDAAQYDEWAQTFDEDAVFEVRGMFKFEGRAAIREFANHIPKNAQGKPGMKHCTLNQIIEVSGERAKATCYLLLIRDGTPLQVDIAGGTTFGAEGCGGPQVGVGLQATKIASDLL